MRITRVTLIGALLSLKAVSVLSLWKVAKHARDVALSANIHLTSSDLVANVHMLDARKAKKTKKKNVSRKASLTAYKAVESSSRATTSAPKVSNVGSTTSQTTNTKMDKVKVTTANSDKAIKTKTANSDKSTATTVKSSSRTTSISTSASTSSAGSFHTGKSKAKGNSVTCLRTAYNKFIKNAKKEFTKFTIKARSSDDFEPRQTDLTDDDLNFVGGMSGMRARRELERISRKTGRACDVPWPVNDYPDKSWSNSAGTFDMVNPHSSGRSDEKNIGT